MALKAVIDSLDGVEEHFHSLYVKKGEKYEISGIEGMRTQGDVDRLQTALNAERATAKAQKVALDAWGDRKPEDVLPVLDKLPELEAQAAAGKNKYNQEQIDAIVAGKLAEPQRKLSAAEKEVLELKQAVADSVARDKRRTIMDAVRSVAVETKAKPESYASEMGGLMLLGDRLFDTNDAGQVVVREGAPGLVQGLGIKDAMPEIQRAHGYLWPDSQGGGSNGNTGSGSPQGNPFKGNNFTARSAFVESNKDKPGVVERAMKEAGVTNPGQRYTGK